MRCWLTGLNVLNLAQSPYLVVKSELGKLINSEPLGI